MRDVVADDAAFILSLRRDPALARYISPVSNELALQQAWIENYRHSTGQAYFIICDGTGGAIGCIRLYGADGDSFEWGSWILQAGQAPQVAIESVLMIYAYAFDICGFSLARFEVMKENTGVWGFHERVFGATRLGETDTQFQYTLDREQFGRVAKKYHALLPQGIRVEAD